MENQYTPWIVETMHTYPHLRSAWRGTVKKSTFAQHGMCSWQRVPHDMAVIDRAMRRIHLVSLPDSLKAIAASGYPVAPIIVQCNTWAVTEYGIESLLFPRAYFFDWKRMGEDWATHFRGKQWWQECWIDVYEVLRIARALAPRMLSAARQHSPQTHGKKLRPSKRLQVLQRDGFRCQICGVTADDGAHVRLEVDHRIPRTRGGTNDLSNLVTLCFACNRGKGTQLLS